MVFAAAAETLRKFCEKSKGMVLRLCRHLASSRMAAIWSIGGERCLIS